MLLYKVICFRKMLKVVLKRHHILKFQSLFTLKFYYLGGRHMRLSLIYRFLF